MSRTLTRFQILLLVLALPAALGAQQDDGATTQGTFELGGWDASTSDSPDLVTEYEPDDGGPDLSLSLDSLQDWGMLELDAQVRHEDDQDYALRFDVHRWLRSETLLNSVLHRLGHESIAHFAAVTNHGRITRHTDLAPDQVYEIDYRLLEHRTELQPRRLGALTLAVGYRQQEREGMRQSTTVSHCDSCHVVSQNRPIDEQTSDGSLEAQVAWGANQLRASVTQRELEDDPAFITLLFDDALHPELRLPLFDNRLQYDSAEGPQPVDGRPDISKDIYRIDGTFGDVGGFVVTAEGVWSQTQNEFMDLEADYAGFLVTAARNFKSSWSLRWRARSYTLDSDDYFVDTVERLGIAGPQAGRTYRELYGFEADFLRQSALNRDVLESKLDLGYRFGKKGGKARFFWEYEDIDREHFEVAPGETASTTNVLGVSWSARPKKGWKTYLLAQRGETDDSFMLVNGAFSTLVSPAVPNPFHPDGAQYFEFHDARIEDTTASPASWDEIKGRASYTSGNTMVTGSYRWWDGDNSEGDLTDWSRTVQAATITLWSAPSPQREWHFAYSWNETDLEAPASIPLFDG